MAFDRLKHNKEYYDKTKEDRKAYARQWHRDNPERSHANKIKWKKKYPINSMVCQARCRSRRLQMEFNIESSDLLPAPTHCPVLGIELVYASQKRVHGSASLERVDNTKGYIKGNVIIISDRANRLKKDATAEELQKLSDFYNKKKETT